MHTKISAVGRFNSGEGYRGIDFTSHIYYICDRRENSDLPVPVGLIVYTFNNIPVGNCTYRNTQSYAALRRFSLVTRKLNTTNADLRMTGVC